MKTISELTDFYYTSLLPTLKELESQRNAIKQRFIVLCVILATIAVFIAMSIKMDYLFILIGYLAICSITYKLLIKDFVPEFKQKVIKPLIGAIDPMLVYDAESFVSENSFDTSSLFSKSDKYSGNDLVSGVIDGIKIEFSDVHAQKKEQNSKGQDHWSTIFQGLFIIADFNKKFKTQTVVLPDLAQNSFGLLIGSWLQSHNFSRDKLVKLDNPLFEKEFVVYSGDQIEARYLLSHSLMEKLLAFKQKSQKKIYISFTGNKIYIAINYNKDLFEPSVFSSLMEYKSVMEYIKTLHLAIGVVNELKLNEKLWGRVA